MLYKVKILNFTAIIGLYAVISYIIMTIINNAGLVWNKSQDLTLMYDYVKQNFLIWLVIIAIVVYVQIINAKKTDYCFSENLNNQKSILIALFLFSILFSFYTMFYTVDSEWLMMLCWWFTSVICVNYLYLSKHNV